MIKVKATVDLVSKPKHHLLENFQRNKSHQLIKFRQHNEFCDLILKCEDGFEIKVHRVVVSSASNYFKDLLTTTLIRKKYKDCISLPDITGSVLEKIISFIYTNEFEEKIEDIEKIITFAVAFQLEELIEICSIVLSESITDQSCLKYWRFAKNNLIYSLEKKCLVYIVSKADDLFQKEMLNDLTIEEIRCLLAEDSLHLQFDEQTIFEHVWKWTTSKVSDTITFPEVFSQVFNLLRFSKLDRDFLVERIFSNQQLLENLDLIKQIASLTTNKQKLQDHEDEPPSKRVSICKITSRKLLCFARNEMLKGLEKDSPPIIKVKPLPRFFGYTTFDNNLFICGGKGSISCEWLEPISEHWQKFPSMKSTKEKHACSYFDSKIYACGGIGSNTVEIFDFGNEKWYSGPDMVSEISNFGLTRVNGSLYAFGDDNIQILDSREKEWSVINSNLRRMNSSCRCVSIGPNIYCFYRDTRNIFDTRVNKFIDVRLENYKCYSDFCELDGYIYGFGFNWDCRLMELAQYDLDGRRGYSKFVRTWYYYQGYTALVALNY